MAERSYFKRFGYNAIRVLARLAGVVAFRIRCHGRRLLPADGGALICANHQSFMDPVLIGLACDRRLNYLARKSLFDIAPLRWLIEFLDAIPIDRDGLGLEGLKETLRRLKRGEMVLIFPEGTRTTDGRVAPLKPGFCSLARRGKAPLVPVGIDGAFDAWPRSSPWPLPAVIHVCIGEPITPEQAATFDDDQLVAELHRRILACHTLARRGRQAGRMCPVLP
jgi:1-acyl-sn-glycerol-3-phosphate acyltransferase